MSNYSRLQGEKLKFLWFCFSFQTTIFLQKLYSSNFNMMAHISQNCGQQQGCWFNFICQPQPLSCLQHVWSIYNSAQTVTGTSVWRATYLRKNKTQTWKTENPMWRFWTRARFLLSGFCMRDTSMFLSPFFTKFSPQILIRYCGLVQKLSARKEEKKSR